MQMIGHNYKTKGLGKSDLIVIHHNLNQCTCRYKIIEYGFTVTGNCCDNIYPAWF